MVFYWCLMSSFKLGFAKHLFYSLLFDFPVELMVAHLDLLFPHLSNLSPLLLCSAEALGHFSMGSLDMENFSISGGLLPNALSHCSYFVGTHMLWKVFLSDSQASNGPFLLKLSMSPLSMTHFLLKLSTQLQGSRSYQGKSPAIYREVFPLLAMVHPKSLLSSWGQGQGFMHFESNTSSLVHVFKG